jgi:glycosyltransferase involved in cell wall biosynthesis
MPLKDSLFERGKCSFKLIQYMGMGKPVVCSPVGENAQVVKHEINGFHAVGCEQWFNSIESLLKETDTCIAMGIKGRALVESYYSLQVQYTNYLKFIDGNS